MNPSYQAGAVPEGGFQGPRAAHGIPGTQGMEPGVSPRTCPRLYAQTSCLKLGTWFGSTGMSIWFCNVKEQYMTGNFKKIK